MFMDVGGNVNALHIPFFESITSGFSGHFSCLQKTV